MGSFFREISGKPEFYLFQLYPDLDRDNGTACAAKFRMVVISSREKIISTREKYSFHTWKSKFPHVENKFAAVEIQMAAKDNKFR